MFDQLIAVGEWRARQRGVDRAEVFDEVTVGGRFVVVAPPDTLDGIVGELVRPHQFG